MFRIAPVSPGVPDSQILSLTDMWTIGVSNMQTRHCVTSSLWPSRLSFLIFCTEDQQIVTLIPVWVGSPIYSARMLIVLGSIPIKISLAEMFEVRTP